MTALKINRLSVIRRVGAPKSDKVLALDGEFGLLHQHTVDSWCLQQLAAHLYQPLSVWPCLEKPEKAPRTPPEPAMHSDAPAAAHPQRATFCLLMLGRTKKLLLLSGTVRDKFTGILELARRDS